MDKQTTSLKQTQQAVIEDHVIGLWWSANRSYLSKDAYDSM